MRSSDVVVQVDRVPKRLVIMEFDSLEAATGFIGSAEYLALDALLRRAAIPRRELGSLDGRLHFPFPEI